MVFQWIGSFAERDGAGATAGLKGMPGCYRAEWPSRGGDECGGLRRGDRLETEGLQGLQGGQFDGEKAADRFVAVRGELFEYGAFVGSKLAGFPTGHRRDEGFGRAYIDGG